MTHYHHVPHYPPQKTGPGPVKIALSVIAVLGFAAVGSCAVCSVVVGSAATEVAEERKAVLDTIGTPDQREGIQAFLEKRKPHFNRESG